MKALPLLVWLVCCTGVSFAQTNVDHRGARSFKSGPIQITADGRWVWSVNPDNDSVTRLDTGDESATEYVLPAGQKHAPKGISVKEDGSEVWVACHDSDRVYVLGPDGAVLARIDLPWGSGPFSVAISPDQKRAVVTLHRAEAAAVLDVPGRRVEKILEHLFWAPMGVAWTEGGKGAWINHIFAPSEHPLQTRLDFSGAEPVVSTSIRITPADPRQSSKLSGANNVAEGGYLNIRGHGAEAPGRNELWLPTQYHNMTQDTYTPDSTMQAVVRRINLTTRKLLEENKDKIILTAKYVHTPTANGAYEGPGWDAHVAGPIDLAFSADGKTAYVLNELSRDLVVLPVSTPASKPAGAAPLPEIAVGDRPIGMALSPTTGRAYVCNLLSRDISVVDLGLLRETKRVPATPLTGEKFPAAVLAGAKIFHSSDDPRISVNAKVACASCHINAEHDGRTWGFDRLPGKHGPRGVTSMLGLRLGMGPKDPTYGWGQLHRSGDRDEIQDFEFTFRNPQMGGTGFLGANANPELGAPNAGRSAELDALAAYLLFLDPLQRSPYRTADGKLTEAAVRGATFFRGNNRAQKRGDAGCAECHVPESGFLDFKFHDIGQARPGAELELNSRTPAWNVNTPTLVGIWATAPYSGTLEGAEAHSARGAAINLLLDASKRGTAQNRHGTPNGLTTRQVADLAEFVLSIDGKMTAAEVAEARDEQGPRIERLEVPTPRQIDVWFNETVDRASAEAIANWSLREVNEGAVPIEGVVWNAQNGDRVTITTRLEPYRRYVLSLAGPILDDAGAASGGRANPADLAAPENRREIRTSDRFTLRLGASGRENVTIGVHDVAMAGTSLSTWSHDSIWIAPSGASPASTTGFIRFDWRNAFALAAGVTNAADILDAAFELQPEFGNGQRVEVRRMLQRWSDPATGGDFNSNPVGAPTWRDSAHPNKRWTVAGAGRLGSSGTNVADYFGSNDLASRVDATVVVASITEPTEVGGSLVTDAFRFWFANPSVDYGYALRLANATGQDLKYARSESGTREESPVLKIAYRVAGAAPRLEGSRSAKGLTLKWPQEAADWRLEQAAALGGNWSDASATPSSEGSVVFVEVPLSGEAMLFRLVRN